MTYLRKHPKTGAWYFRRTIPAGLRPHLAKGSDWYESLGTKDLAQAKKLVKAVGQRVDAAFDAARAKLEVETASPASTPVVDTGLEWLKGFDGIVTSTMVARRL